MTAATTASSADDELKSSSDGGIPQQPQPPPPTSEKTGPILTSTAPDGNDSNDTGDGNEKIATMTTSSPAPLPPPPAGGTEFKPDTRFWLAFAPITVLALMVSLDGTSVSVALPIISRDLDGTAIEAFWMGTSFLLTSAVFQLPIGALSDIFGRTMVLTACVLLFMIGIILSAAAQNFGLMLAGRTIQGIGGGGVILLNDIIITDLVPMRQRGAYFGMVGGVWALGSVTGPVIGGALAYRASWVSRFFQLMHLVSGILVDIRS